jgi:hypothetical protein
MVRVHMLHTLTPSALLHLQLARGMPVCMWKKQKMRWCTGTPCMLASPQHQIQLSAPRHGAACCVADVDDCSVADYLCKDPATLTCTGKLNDCSAHGDCYRGFCYCHVGWGGRDCSAPICLGQCEDVRPAHLLSLLASRAGCRYSSQTGPLLCMEVFRLPQQAVCAACLLQGFRSDTPGKMDVAPNQTHAIQVTIQQSRGPWSNATGDHTSVLTCRGLPAPLQASVAFQNAASGQRGHATQGAPATFSARRRVATRAPLRDDRPARLGVDRPALHRRMARPVHRVLA